MLPGVDGLTNEQINKLALQFNRRPSQVMRVLKTKPKDFKKIFEKKK